MKNIVCLGDSTTYGYMISRKKVWPSILNNKFAEEGKEINIINKGINGDTTSGMIARFERDCLNENADLLILMGGVNDIFMFQNIDKIKDNIKLIVETSNKNNVDINRNFPTNNWELSSKNKFYGGEKPASEIETRFLTDIIEKYNPQIILALHSPYKLVNYDGDAFELALKIAEIIDYPVEASIGYPTPGSLGTWAGIERNIKTITLELDEKADIKDLSKPVFKIFEMLENYK